MAKSAAIVPIPAAADAPQSEGEIFKLPRSSSELGLQRQQRENIFALFLPKAARGLLRQSDFPVVDFRHPGQLGCPWASFGRMTS